MFKCLTKGCSSIPVLIAPDSSHVSDDTAKANLLNNNFTSSFNSVSSNFNLTVDSHFPQEVNFQLTLNLLTMKFTQW